MKDTSYWVFEGSDGIGKTELSKAFCKRINGYWTYEPNAETPHLKKMREMALDKTLDLDDYAREYLLMANRSEHHKKDIRPMLEYPDYKDFHKPAIVSDRSFMSGMVYAALAAFGFDNWLSMMFKSSSFVLPEVIIHCTNEERKVKINAHDIYDSAEQETFDRIDRLYWEAKDHIQCYPPTGNIKFVTFDINFDRTVEENCEELFKTLKFSV